MIRLEDLGKTYQGADGPVEAIRHIDLQVEDGDIFGVIGLSGAGKSTLVRCINYLERPTEGRVLFDGVDLGTLRPPELRAQRRRMSMVFQSFNLLAQRTALRNVCYPLEIAGWPRGRARARAMELLEMVGLAQRAGAYPSQLSGGQKQRVAIARALASDPAVLLCDEVTSALDPNTTRSILELLQHINRTLGVTIILITHEMRVIEQICNKVAVLDSSRLVEVGPVSEVFMAPRSRMARQLIFPEGRPVERLRSTRRLRLVFDGHNAFEPIVSNLTLECRTPVNILAANTKLIDGRLYGQMALQLPQDPALVQRIRAYLESRGVHYEEYEEEDGQDV